MPAILWKIPSKLFCNVHTIADFRHYETLTVALKNILKSHPHNIYLSIQTKIQYHNDTASHSLTKANTW